MGKCKLVGLFVGTILAVLAILASAPASCQGSAGGSEYWIIIDKPLDSEVKDWKPQFRGPNAKVLDKLSLKPGDTVRVKVTGVNDLLYDVTTTLLVKPVPSSTAGLDFFMGKGFTSAAPLRVADATACAATSVQEMRELPTRLVAGLVKQEADWQKNGRRSSEGDKAAWVRDVQADCMRALNGICITGPDLAGKDIISKGKDLLKDVPASDAVAFDSRVNIAARIYDRVLNLQDGVTTQAISVPEGNADCDVKVVLVPVDSVEGEPLNYPKTKAPPPSLATREKTFTVSEGERKASSGTAGVIFALVRDNSYALEERDITEGDPPTTTTKKYIVSRGDTDELTVGVGYLHHFKWEERYVSFGVGAGQNSLSYFLGLSWSFGSGERPIYVSFGGVLAQVLRLDQVSLGQEYGGTVVPTKKVYKPGWALAVSIQF